MSSRFACRINLSLDSLSQEELEEAIGNCVVMTVTTSAHAAHQVIRFQRTMPILLLNWLPLLECTITVPCGLRRQTADNEAFSTNSVVMLGFIDQPTT